MKVEICTYGFDNAQAAQMAGAHRIELCGGRPEGGTTPSAGLVHLVRSQLLIPASVMLRPRGGHFYYNPSEVSTLFADLEWLADAGVKSVVTGVLTPEGHLHLPIMKDILAMGLEVVVHRAIDVSVQPLKTLQQCIDLGVKRILTSGGAPKAIDGLNVIRQMVELSNDRIEIMPGSGVNSQNVAEFLKIGVHAVHLSATQKVKIGSGISMAAGQNAEDYWQYQTDEDEIKRVLLEVEKQGNSI